MLNLEHIDPKKSHLVSGLTGNEYNEIIADESYNKRKNNRFVPYRVCDYPAPVTFGDIGEFLIEGEWVVCKFGGELWWAESNRIGNAQVEAGRKGVRSQPREAKVLGGQRGTEAIRERGVGIYGLTPEQRVENGRIGGAVTASRGYLDYGSENSIKTFESLSAAGKIGGRSGLNADPEYIRERGRRGGATQGPRNKGMAWYHRYDKDGNIVRKRSKTPLPEPWLPGKGKTK
jgi:general stress protein YciG